MVLIGRLQNVNLDRLVVAAITKVAQRHLGTHAERRVVVLLTHDNDLISHEDGTRGVAERGTTRACEVCLGAEEPRGVCAAEDLCPPERTPDRRIFCHVRRSERYSGRH